MKNIVTQMNIGKNGHNWSRDFVAFNFGQTTFATLYGGKWRCVLSI